MHYLPLLLLLAPLALTSPLLAALPTLSPDGTCGPTSLSNFTCPSTSSDFGPCCSSYGYCGSASLHCDEGCQPDFGKCTDGKAKLSPDGTCGGKKGYVCSKEGVYAGGCCSEKGFCGSTGAYCGAGCQGGFSATGACITEKGKIPSVDGRCGEEHGGTNCEGGPYHGLCCSGFGYCGGDEKYCSKANGCQEGFGAACTVNVTAV
ncbi:hypothetical protein BJ508DRAFT_303567 [Ascobolus immersus RN42]|uniref:Chitin-binding type-1 domain-containing protein n=1 Tax=Ascobolus immersus RN42 TaxID=1160509 RepID=A0A3N4IGR0_ASCIM|nr:hypothetical protein BJ508DRAFT_303567 [Ascobolus immersus RN42]